MWNTRVWFLAFIVCCWLMIFFVVIFVVTTLVVVPTLFYWSNLVRRRVVFWNYIDPYSSIDLTRPDNLLGMDCATNVRITVTTAPVATASPKSLSTRISPSNLIAFATQSTEKQSALGNEQPSTLFSQKNSLPVAITSRAARSENLEKTKSSNKRVIRNTKPNDIRDEYRTNCENIFTASGALRQTLARSTAVSVTSEEKRSFSVRQFVIRFRDTVTQFSSRFVFSSQAVSFCRLRRHFRLKSVFSIQKMRRSLISSRWHYSSITGGRFIGDAAQSFTGQCSKPINLGVWHIPAPCDKNCEMFSSGRPVVLFLHGSAASRATPIRLEKYRMFATKLGADVVTFDYRGYGDSTGQSDGIEPTLGGVVEDALAVYYHIRQFVPPQRIIIWGHSLGAGIAMHLLERLNAHSCKSISVPINPALSFSPSSSSSLHFLGTTDSTSGMAADSVPTFKSVVSDKRPIANFSTPLSTDCSRMPRDSRMSRSPLSNHPFAQYFSMSPAVTSVNKPVSVAQNTRSKLQSRLGTTSLAKAYTDAGFFGNVASDEARRLQQRFKCRSSRSSTSTDQDRTIERPAGVVLETPFDRIGHVLRDHQLTRPLRFFPYFDRIFSGALHSDPDTDFDSIALVDRIDPLVPVLLLAARDDPIVPCHLAENLYARFVEVREPTPSNSHAAFPQLLPSSSITSLTSKSCVYFSDTCASSSNYGIYSQSTALKKIHETRSVSTVNSVDTKGINFSYDRHAYHEDPHVNFFKFSIESKNDGKNNFYLNQNNSSNRCASVTRKKSVYNRIKNAYYSANDHRPYSKSIYSEKASTKVDTSNRPQWQLASHIAAEQSKARQRCEFPEFISTTAESILFRTVAETDKCASINITNSNNQIRSDAKNNGFISTSKHLDYATFDDTNKLSNGVQVRRSRNVEIAIFDASLGYGHMLIHRNQHVADLVRRLIFREGWASSCSYSSSLSESTNYIANDEKYDSWSTKALRRVEPGLEPLRGLQSDR